MSRLQVVQRRYMLASICEAVADKLNKQIDKQLPTLIAEHGNVSVKTAMPYRQSEWADMRLGLHKDYRLRLDKQYCAESKKLAEEYANDYAKLPRTWWEEEIKKKRYHVEVVFEPCMTSPKTRVIFDNYEKAIKKERTRIKRNYGAARKKALVLIDDIQAQLLAVNKHLDKIAGKIVLMGADDADKELLKLKSEIFSKCF